ncbi:MAG: DUF4118 domain-containing protein [Aphanocapsa sp. GSE-SYN-MK-11-07L]|jgi:PAS domain S-box-containing protein|nr:DUF4118 domain-containing protein [Aphanocapsa sp. GSE-SYN-MK-11-07L]
MKAAARTQKNPWLHYGLATFSVALALALTLLLSPWLYPTVTPLFFVAVLVSAWLGGWEAGLLATVLSVLAINYSFIEPLYSLQVGDDSSFVRLSTFLIAAGFISWLTHSRRAALEQAKVNYQALKETLEREGTAQAESRQAEANLRESEEKYRTLFDAIDEGFCIIDIIFDPESRPIDYRFVQTNPAFIRLTGLPQNTLGKTARQLVPDLEEFWFETYGQVALTGEAVRFENKSEPMNRWFDVYASRVGDASSRRVAVVFNNISDRKQSEAALQRAANFSAFCVSLADALRPLADPVEVQAIASRVLGEYLGANRVVYFEVQGDNYVVERDYVNGASPLVGNYPVDSFGPKLLAAYRSGCAVSVADVGADRNLSPAQRLAYAAVQIGAYIGIPLVKGGQLIAGLAVHTAKPRAWTTDEVALAEEVAERTWAAVEQARAEAALRESESQLKLASESAKLGLWFWNLETDTLTWTEQCKALFGLPADADMSYEIFLAALHPDDRQPTQAAVMQSINDHLDYNIEYRTCWPDHTLHWIAAKGSCTYDPTGQPIRMMGVALDISDRKQAEAEREQLLEREQAAREAAEQANRIKDEFLAVLSHELRSPLNPILGWSKLLQKGKLDAAKTKQALATIERNAQLQAELIDDLLDVARILRGKLSLTVSAVNLTTTIHSAIETVRLAAEAKSITIKPHLESELGSVAGDPTRLQQVVWNLLSNAVKFTPAGGLVEVHLEQVEQQVQFTVTDNGKGIGPEFLPHVFDYFRQADSTTTRKFGGLGLGLAIVRQIVELHGGTIWAESQGEGLGARFTVQLPLMPTQAAVNLESETAATLNLNGIQVLVVDDEADSREFIAFVVEQAGATVKTAAAAAEAIAILRLGQFDILLSDIGMPELDGYALIQQVRGLPLEQNRQIKAIALTAYAGDFNQEQALAAGFQKHLSKPVEPEGLVRAIAELSKQNTLK